MIGTVARGRGRGLGAKHSAAQYTKQPTHQATSFPGQDVPSRMGDAAARSSCHSFGDARSVKVGEGDGGGDSRVRASTGDLQSFTLTS